MVCFGAVAGSSSGFTFTVTTLKMHQLRSLKLWGLVYPTSPIWGHLLPHLMQNKTKRNETKQNKKPQNIGYNWLLLFGQHRCERNDGVCFGHFVSPVSITLPGTGSPGRRMWSCALIGYLLVWHLFKWLKQTKHQFILQTYFIHNKL